MIAAIRADDVYTISHSTAAATLALVLYKQVRVMLVACQCTEYYMLILFYLLYMLHNSL
jgi:hypothetical protein